MSDKQTGTPPCEGWYKCELETELHRIYWWNGRDWYREQECLYGGGCKVLSWRGPLVIAEPSQTARERAFDIASNLLPIAYTEGWNDTEEKFFVDAILPQITAAEQAAYQRGKEEGRREERKKTQELLLNPYGEKVAAINGESPAKVCGRVLGAILADQPAQPPAEPEETIAEKFMKNPAALDRLMKAMESVDFVNDSMSSKPAEPPFIPEQIPEYVMRLESRVAALEAWASAYPSWREKK